LSVLNTQILKLTRNIAVICQSLTPHEDVSKKWVVGTAFTTTNTGEPCAASRELSGLLAQLTTTDALHRETLDGHICLVPMPYTHVTGGGQHGNEHFQDDEDEARDKAEQSNPRYWVQRIQYLLQQILDEDKTMSIDPQLFRVCDRLKNTHIHRYLITHSVTTEVNTQNNIRVNLLYDMLVTAIKPFYTLSNPNQYKGEVQRLLRNVIFDLFRLGGLFNSQRRFELRACLNV
jgi:hypothetical protein